MLAGDRRVVSVLLLVLVACTGRGLSPGATGSPATPTRQASSRTRTTLEMEVGPSVHPGSFRAAGRLTYRLGAPVAGATVRVTLTPVGVPGTPRTFDLGTRRTDVAGGFQVTFHPPQKGTFLVEARFAGDARLEPAYDQGSITAT